MVQTIQGVTRTLKFSLEGRLRAVFGAQSAITCWFHQGVPHHGLTGFRRLNRRPWH